MTPVTYNRSYFATVLRAIDMFVAVLITKDYDITISSYTGLAMRRASPPRWARALNWFLNKCEKNHCELAILADIKRAQLSLDMLAPPVVVGGMGTYKVEMWGDGRTEPTVFSMTQEEHAALLKLL